VITTRGEEGAEITSTRLGTLQQKPPIIKDLVDTVGAGDAFSALVIYGIMSGWPQDLILARAVEFAADICKIQGATTDNKKLYTNRLEQWKSKGA